MAKRIGILTFHRAINYGAAMQAYALWKSLSDLGAASELIDYRNPHIEKLYLTKWGRRSTLKGYKDWFPTIKPRRHKSKLFHEFLNAEMKLSQPYTPENIAQITNVYDALVTGSDQVFAPPLSGKDKAFFLGFDGRAKKYSYAASTGSYKFDSPDDTRFLSMISQFDGVSIRESAAKPLMEYYLSNDVRVDCDPTMLLDANQWGVLADKAKPRTKPYVFVYTVHKPKRALEVADRVAEARGCEVVYLHNRILDAKETDEGRVTLHDSSPYEWLRLIREAECVLTNSFHGTVFSIIFRRPFYAEIDTKGGFNNRAWNLLMDTGLNDCVLERTVLDEEHSYENDVMNWDYANEAIDRKRKDSLEYLRSIVQD